MGSAVAAHCRLEKFTSWRCDVHGIAKNDSKCGVQVSAKTIDDSNGHHLDTRTISVLSTGAEGDFARSHKN